MEVKYHPCNSICLVEVAEQPKDLTYNGLHIPETCSYGMPRGKILEAGPHVSEQVQVGETYMWLSQSDYPIMNPDGSPSVYTGVDERTLIFRLEVTEE